MAFCKHCGGKLDEDAAFCAGCGKSLKSKPKQGTAIFCSTKDFIGLIGRYIITDKNGNVLAMLKPGESYETNINSETVFYIRRKGGFGSSKEAFARANEINKFLVGPDGTGMSFSVSKID